MVEIYSVAVEKKTAPKAAPKDKRGRKSPDAIVEEWSGADEGAIKPAGGQMVAHGDDAQVSDYYDLLQLTEEMLAGRNANRTNTVVTALVQYIIRSWRDHYARTVAMKFNCFFLMPFLDDFPAYLVSRVCFLLLHVACICEI